MKVLKKGRPKGWKCEYDCADCGARLEVSDTDCKRVSDPRDGDYFAFNCPECKCCQSLDCALVKR